jgi:hypothetical protein
MRKLARSMLVGACSLAGLLATAPAASAAPIPGKGDCDYTEYCVYEHANRTGGIVAVAGNIPDYDAWIFVEQGSGKPLWVNLNDHVSSAFNYGSPGGVSVVHSFRHSFQREEIWWLNPGTGGNCSASQNDQASSHNWQRS